MKPAALGFRVHSGWAAMVAVALEERFPIPLLRERPHLVKTFTLNFASPITPRRRSPLTKRANSSPCLRAEAGAMADSAIQSARESLRTRGYELLRSALLTSSARPLPELPGFSASHALIHTADGELFREALLEACNRHALPTLTIKESELLESACRAMHLSADETRRTGG